MEYGTEDKNIMKKIMKVEFEVPKTHNNSEKDEPIEEQPNQQQEPIKT